MSLLATDVAVIVFLVAQAFFLVAAFAFAISGLDDLAIHDLIQVTAYFNYINRIADAVHVDLEPEMPAYPE